MKIERLWRRRPSSLITERYFQMRIEAEDSEAIEKALYAYNIGVAILKLPTDVPWELDYLPQDEEGEASYLAKISNGYHEGHPESSKPWTVEGASRPDDAINDALRRRKA